MTNADRMFDGAAELGRIIAAQRTAVRKATHEAQLARRRARYAALKPHRAPAPAVTVSTADEDYEPFCTCYRSAPCHYCTDIVEEED